MNLQLDRDDSLSLRASGGIHQPLLTSLLPKLVKPGDTVIDVGAHIGYFTVQFAELVGKTGMVFAYEPNRPTYKILCENLRDYPNTLPFHGAVSNEISIAKLFLCDENSGDHRLYAEGNRRWVSSFTMTLDKMHGHLDKIDLLKIDVQGWEGFVLEGCVEHVLPMTKKIVLEWWPTGLKAAGYEPWKLLTLLEAYGFGLSEIDEIDGKVFRTTPDYLLDTFKVKADASTENIKPGDFTDILAIGKGATIDLSEM